MNPFNLHQLMPGSAEASHPLSCQTEVADRDWIQAGVSPDFPLKKERSQITHRLLLRLILRAPMEPTIVDQCRKRAGSTPPLSVMEATLRAAREKVNTLRERLVAGEITFKEAALEFSDDKETKNNGGQLVNPVTLDTRFDLNKMDPVLSGQIYNLKEGEISKVHADTDFSGKATFKILTISKRFDEHTANFTEDYEKIKGLALTQKQIKEIKKWQARTIVDTYINVNADYQACTFSNNWLKN